MGQVILLTDLFSKSSFLLVTFLPTLSFPGPQSANKLASYSFESAQVCISGHLSFPAKQTTRCSVVLEDFL